MGGQSHSMHLKYKIKKIERSLSMLLLPIKLHYVANVYKCICKSARPFSILFPCISWLTESTWATMTKPHRLGTLSSRHLFHTTSGTNSRLRNLVNSVLMSTLFLFLPWKDLYLDVRSYMSSDISSFSSKDNILISGPLEWPHDSIRI